MSKIDFKKQNIPFTMVANGVLTDKRLSLKAKGLYAILYSKPEGWDFSGDRIAEFETKDKRVAVYNSLKELEESGYLKRERLASGRMAYKIVYPPNAENQQHTEKPLAEKAKETKPLFGKTSSISNTDNISNKENTSNTIAETSSAQAIPFSLEEEIQKLKDSPRRELKIIGWFISVKKIPLKSKDQVSTTIRRHLRAAKLISPFSKQQIEIAEDAADRQIGNKWTLETIYKLLTK